MDTKKKMNWVDIVVSLAAYGLAIFVFVYSESFKKTQDNSLNPAVWPRIICGLLCIAATVQLINALKGKISTCITVKNKKEVITAIIAVILYVMLLKSVGYIICSVLLMVVLLIIFREKKPWIYVVLPVVTTGAAWFMFHSLLRVPLPAGFLRFLG